MNINDYLSSDFGSEIAKVAKENNTSSNLVAGGIGATVGGLAIYGLTRGKVKAALKSKGKWKAMADYFRRGKGLGNTKRTKKVTDAALNLGTKKGKKAGEIIGRSKAIKEIDGTVLGRLKQKVGEKARKIGYTGLI